MTLLDSLTTSDWSEFQINDIYDFQVEGETIEWYYDNDFAISNVGTSWSTWYEETIRIYIDYADSIVDLDFVRTFDQTESDLDFFVEEYNPDYPDYHDYAGLFVPQFGWSEIYLNLDLSDSGESTMNTILHEIGHYLGLDEIGYDIRWDQLDSAMSYNSSLELEGGYQLTFTSNDIDALVSLHGSEDDTSVASDFADNLTGSVADDEIRALGGDDLVESGAGDDLIYGNQGEDTIKGGLGNDILFGGKDDDLITGNQGEDRVYGNLGDDLIYGGKSNDSLYGGQGADVLYGNLGDDLIYGGKSNDTLHGGQGADVLYGNPGADLFRLSAGSDRVMDFEANKGDLIGIRSDMAYTIKEEGSDLLINTDIGSLRLVGTDLSSFNSAESIVEM